MGELLDTTLMMICTSVLEIVQPSKDFHSVIINDLASSVQLMCSLYINISSNVSHMVAQW